MKTNLYLCIIILLLFILLPAHIYADFLYTVTNNQVSITGFDGNLIDELSLPATIDDKPVYEIAKYAFKNQKGITSVCIPASVKYIGENAFKDCIALQIIKGSKETVIVKGYAFYNCISLTSVVLNIHIDNQNSGNIFGNCMSLSHIDLPETLSRISHSMFSKCYKLSHIDIPDSVTSIDGYAFEECGSLTNVTIGKKVTNIGPYAFQRCHSLHKIHIPPNVTDISEHSFGECKALKDVIFNEGLVRINDGAFSHCIQLERITLPDSLVYIGRIGFYNCTELKEFTFGKEIQYIGDDILANCYKLSRIYFRGTPPKSRTNKLYSGNINLVVYYPENQKGWKDTFAGLPTKPYKLDE